MPHQDTAKASRKARAKAFLEQGLEPDEVFMWLVDRWRNGRMSEEKRTELALQLLPFTKPKLKAVAHSGSIDGEFSVKIVIGGEEARLNGGFYQQRTFGKKGATTGLRDNTVTRLLRVDDHRQPEADLQNPSLQFSCCGQVRPRTAKVSASLTGDQQHSYPLSLWQQLLSNAYESKSTQTSKVGSKRTLG